VDECLGSAAWTDAAPASAALPCLRAVVRMEGAASLDANIASLVRDGEAVPAAALDACARQVRPSDVALLLYTSGSTATPKGVQLLHGTLIAHAFDIGEAQALGAGDRYWITLPLFWSAGSANTTMAVLTHGATAVLQEFFDPSEAVRLLRDERCTHYFAFPNVTQAIHRALGDAPRLPAARTAVTSGQPEILALLRTMGFTRLLHPYGTTEDYGFATINDPGDSDEVLGWSQGRPLPGIELRICDPATGAVLARGSAGEICLRGNVTPGYYKDEDKNRAAFDREGFFHTGDAAIQHADGRLQFLGRLKEMIKTSGFNVSPAEVEAALLALPGVIEAYVVPVPDAERGQAVAACVRVSTSAISTDALRRHCTGTLSSYKVPRVFLPLDSFPMTATGKVSKEALRELATKHAAAGGT
jgi:fatty-acyl-CoA synthase